MTYYVILYNYWMISRYTLKNILREFAISTSRPQAARLILQISLARPSTHRWQIDSFTDSYIAPNTHSVLNVWPTFRRLWSRVFYKDRTGSINFQSIGSCILPIFLARVKYCQNARRAVEIVVVDSKRSYLNWISWNWCKDMSGTTLNCNRQSTCMPQLQLLCSSALVPMNYPGG